MIRLFLSLFLIVSCLNFSLSQGPDLLAEVNEIRYAEEINLLHNSDILNEIAKEIADIRSSSGLESLSDNEINQMIIDAGLQSSYFVVETWEDTAEAPIDVLEGVTQENSDVLLQPLGSHLGYGAVQQQGVRTHTIIIASLNTCMPSEQEDLLEIQNSQAERVLELVNEMRLEHDLNPLTLNTDKLYLAARWYADDSKYNGYAPVERIGQPHIGSDDSAPIDRVTREGYIPAVVRENAALIRSFDADYVFQGWWDSPGHKANILAPDIREMGLAFTCNEESGNFYYIQVFGTPFVPQDTNQVEDELFDLINDTRVEENLTGFTSNPVLEEYAESYASYFLQNYEFPDNYWEDLSEGYAWKDIGVYASASRLDPHFLVEQWLETHGEELLSSTFTEIGISTVLDLVEDEYLHVVLVAQPLLESEEDILKPELLELINVARSDSDLAPLTSIEILDKFTQETAQFVVDTGGFASTLWDDLGQVYSWDDIQIFAVGVPASYTPQETIDLWFSRYSNALLSNTLSEIGIGVVFAEGQNNYMYVVIIALPE